MSRFDIICIHTMVGSLAGTDSYFRSGNGAGFSGTESHFGTGSDGSIWQWQDTAFRAEANLNGNHRLISIENADYGIGFGTWNTNDGGAVPAFTAAQAEAIARILAWASKEHNIPLVLIPDSAPGRRGVGYHRQGVDPYRVSGGEQWSLAYGKVCPGNKRIAQIPGIIARARQIAAGNITPEEEVVTTAEQDSIASKVVAKLLGEDVNADMAGVQSLRNVVSQTWTNSRAVIATQAAHSAAIKALTQIVADQEGYDPVDVAQQVQKAVDDALAGKVVFDVDQVDVNVSPEPSA
jgi:hypothetical protein